jgi:hypothetical protein
MTRRSLQEIVQLLEDRDNDPGYPDASSRAFSLWHFSGHGNVNDGERSDRPGSKDRAGNGAEIYSGSTKPYPRAKNRMGYDGDSDQSAYDLGAESKQNKSRPAGMRKTIIPQGQFQAEETEVLLENVSKKHFQSAADLIRTVSDPEKRQSHADMFDAFFSQHHPKFDTGKFHRASGTRTKAERNQ